HDRLGVDRGGREFLADRPPCRKERDLDVPERIARQFFDRVRLPTKFNLFAGTAPRRKQAQRPDGEIALGKDGQEFLADSAGGARNGDVNRHGENSRESSSGVQEETSKYESRR